MKRRVLLMSSSALAAALLVGGCGDDGSPAATSTQSSGSPASQTPTSAATPDTVERAEGLALLVKPQSSAPSVQVLDWKTGKVVQSLRFQLTDGGFGVDVSSDLRYAVRKGGRGSIEVYKADPLDGYVLAGSVQESADSFSAGKVTFGDEPKFNPKDGRAWITAEPAEGDPYFVSIDPARPTQKPRRERARRTDLAANSPWGFDRDGVLWEAGRDQPTGTVTVAGKKGYEVEYWNNVSGGIASAGLTFTDDPTYGPAAYSMIDKLSPNTLLLQFANGMADNDAGELLQVTIDRAKRTASYRAVIPTSADPVVVMALCPDRRTMMIGTANAWYRMPLGGTSDQAEKLSGAQTSFLTDLGSLGKVSPIR